MSTLVLLEIDCVQPDEALDRWVVTLPEEVQKRAARYLCPRARRNLIVTQTVLRQCLATLELSEDDLRVCPNGRPWHRGSDLEFNLSHSHQRAVLALGRHSELERRLGVDIEWMDRGVERNALAKRFFTPRESDFSQDSAVNFFTIWTRKEAILKSNGVGLRVELNSFDVLEQKVNQEVSGYPLFLDTALRSRNYIVSWALPQSFEGCDILWLDCSDPGWPEALAEGIEG